MSYSLSFLHPLILTGLLLLPVFWLILSALPPEPILRQFPPMRFLRGLRDETAIPQKIPLWLRLMRLVLLACAILALAGPVLLPPSEQEADRPILIVIDDGWANTPVWSKITDSARALASTADFADQKVALVFTTPIHTENGPVTYQTLAEIRTEIRTHETSALAPDHPALARRLITSQELGTLPSPLRIYWLSDGLDYGGAAQLLEQLGKMGQVQLLTDPAHDPIRLTALRTKPDGMVFSIARQSSKLEYSGAILAEDRAGKVLARQAFTLKAGARLGDIKLSLPLALRNRMGTARIEGIASAGAVRVLDASWARPRIGIVGGGSRNGDQPLLSEHFYLEKALQPFGETTRIDLSKPGQELPPIVVLLDTGKLSNQAHARLTDFVEQGGFLIRFAGPRLAAHQDDLIPVTLRSGGRLLGSALGWDKPQQMAPFADTSPFFGLDHSRPINVTRQVLAQSVPGLSAHVWARLTDGTPLVTSAARGQGRIVLFHVTASPAWSQLPLSGVFVDMLKRILPLAARPNSTLSAEQASTSTVQLRMIITAKGQFAVPGTGHQVLQLAEDVEPVSKQHPAGLWGNSKITLARNVLDHLPISDFPTLPPNVSKGELSGGQPILMAGSLLLIALGLLVIDSLAILWMGGKLPGRRQISLLLFWGLLLSVPIGVLTNASSVQAQQSNVFEAIEQTRLAYVVTHNHAVDTLSKAGLAGLSHELNMRTTVEPGEPLAIDLETAEINLVSFLYWPVLGNVDISEQAADKLNVYLKNGGMLILDTQDGGLRADTAGGIDPALASLFAKIDIPGLTEIPNDHVLTRAYYLISKFPGRYAGSPVWVEADSRGSNLDGVSSLIIGSNDWAAAWAIDANGKPMAGLSGEIERQREMSRRFGINLVMYVLSGNYKADQVHIPALLERLGQ
ncbi:MAG: hypothetical protein COA47_08160 [Robiginitomaculum sp.]|nr:MAG: hypothetical protein COA47_08160 [Robiginitomaculum sp.]